MISVLTSRFPEVEGLSLWEGSVKLSYTLRYMTIHLSSTASRLSTGDRGLVHLEIAFIALFPISGSPRKGKMLT